MLVDVIMFLTFLAIPSKSIKLMLIARSFRWNLYLFFCLFFLYLSPSYFQFFSRTIASIWTTTRMMITGSFITESCHVMLTNLFHVMQCHVMQCLAMTCEMTYAMSCDSYYDSLRLLASRAIPLTFSLSFHFIRIRLFLGVSYEFSKTFVIDLCWI